MFTKNISLKSFLILFSWIGFKTPFIDGNISLDEKPMVIVTPSYNNINWFKLNLDSIITQKYTNYRIIYIDDHSKDGTCTGVEKYLQDLGIDFRYIQFDDSFSDDIPAITKAFVEVVNREHHFITLITNTNRCGALANLYRAIHSCKDNEIVVTVDGDDWLYHDEVLKQLNEVYSSKDIWFTHGTLIEYPWGNVTWSEPIAPEAIEEDSFRKFKCPSHLRTFYAWLFKKIKLEDFLYKGKFFPMAWDMAIMFPICEMAKEHHMYISEVTYVYNMANNLNDNKVDPQLQNELDRMIRNKEHYLSLEKEEPEFIHAMQN